MYKKVVVFIILLLILGNCERIDDPINNDFVCESENNSINFIFKYGITLKNILNTFDCKYQKDLVLDPPIETNLKLSKTEIDSIYTKMIEINFLEYPDTFIINFSTDTIPEITPSMIYYFYLENDSIQKQFYWDDAHPIQDDKADDLRSLMMEVIEIIHSKNEYKNLPDPRGGYI